MEIYVDTGISFTHAVATGRNEIAWAKVGTNQGNPKRSLISCLQELARKLGLAPAEMLSHTLFIRWSSSIASELLVQGGRGKLGLIVSKDLENTLRSSSKGESGMPSYLAGVVRSDMIVGIKGQVDKSGRVMEDVSEEEVSKVMERLVDSGATGIIVSLSGSFFNSLQEKKVREIMRRKYPAHYLGSTDLFLGSEVAASPDDRLRTHTAVLNAYFHRDITHHANGVEDAAHDAGYKLPLLIAHGTGAVATQVRTKALDLWNSSIAGEALGCATLAKQLYGIRDFIYMDVGGGSRAHIGIVSQGKAFTTYEPVVGNISVNVPTVEVMSASGGGNSIAQVESSRNLITVGPLTAALSGGPAAYGLGGPEPTVMDADLVLGYLDPDGFLGDSRKLDREKSVAAIREKIVAKTGQLVEEAAYAITETAEKNIAEAIKQEMQRKKISPARLTLFAFGGAGGSRCCGCASRLGLKHIIVHQFNAVASAVLSSMVDLFHIYKNTTKVTLRSRQGDFLSPGEYNAFNKRLQQIEEEARADIQAEGLKSENARFVMELELSGSAGSSVVEHPLFRLTSEAQVVEVCNSYASCFPDSGAQGSEVNIESITLRAEYPASHAKFPVYDYQGADAAKAIKGERQVYWGQGFSATPIYQQGLLASGNVVPGPAVIEAPGTTYLVAPGWKYTVDQYLNGDLEVQK
jgi:N-methylhydantoinase A